MSDIIIGNSPKDTKIRVLLDNRGYKSFFKFATQTMSYGYQDDKIELLLAVTRLIIIDKDLTYSLYASEEQVNALSEMYTLFVYIKDLLGYDLWSSVQLTSDSEDFGDYQVTNSDLLLIDATFYCKPYLTTQEKAYRLTAVVKQLKCIEKRATLIRVGVTTLDQMMIKSLKKQNRIK